MSSIKSISPKKAIGTASAEIRGELEKRNTEKTLSQHISSICNSPSNEIPQAGMQKIL
jgi:hypothetical protein